MVNGESNEVLIKNYWELSEVVNRLTCRLMHSGKTEVMCFCPSEHVQ